MSKKTLYLLGILLTIIIGMYFYWRCCCNGAYNSAVVDDDSIEQTSFDSAPTLTETQTPTNNGFALNDADGDFNFTANDNFNFDPSSFTIRKPISAQLDGGINQLKAYLDGNATKSVDITGLYGSDEENASAYPNLGLARANAVKNYFSEKGISSSRMNTLGKQWDDWIPENNIYKGPITFGVSTADDNSNATEEAEIKALGDQIRANPLVLHFASGSNSINLTPEQRQKVADISKYLDKVEGANVSVVGHTDNTSSRVTNTRLGLERAVFAKNYLVNNGIPESKINTASKGPDEPVASNDTEEGRTQNRRTVVTIN